MKILIAILLFTAPAFAGMNNLPWDDNPKVYDSDGNFMGSLNPSPYDPDSINNPNGIYGSPHQPDSVNFGDHEVGSYHFDSGSDLETVEVIWDD